MNKLYSFSSISNMKSNCPDLVLSSSSASASAQSEASSSSNSGLYSGLGTITKVANGNNVSVTTNQGVQTINLDACSIKLANIPNYSWSAGDVLVWKGVYDNSNSIWNANQVTCFH